jgi:cytochrome c oxidase subunit I
MHGTRLAWTALWLVIAGAVTALATVAAGEATVLYTFYPPLSGSAYYYIGILTAVAGSWIWIGLMVSHFGRWKRDHPGRPVPLAMFAFSSHPLHRPRADPDRPRHGLGSSRPMVPDRPRAVVKGAAERRRRG